MEDHPWSPKSSSFQRLPNASHSRCPQIRPPFSYKSCWVWGQCRVSVSDIGLGARGWGRAAGKERVGESVTHTRIQYQDWATSSKILTVMSRALRLSRTPLLGRDRVRWGCCGGKGYRTEMWGQEDAHLIPWEMEVLLEIPGSSGRVLFSNGRQRPRAGGREPGLLGGRAQSFASKASGLHPAPQ